MDQSICGNTKLRLHFKLTTPEMLMKALTPAKELTLASGRATLYALDCTSHAIATSENSAPTKAQVKLKMVTKI
jgi:hypothetical protein